MTTRTPTASVRRVWLTVLAFVGVGIGQLYIAGCIAEAMNVELPLRHFMALGIFAGAGTAWAMRDE